ncbi:MAG TPA: hypothetical protein VGR95_05025 [Thermoanaerobaculia bacterium]|jgi:hypothetical protein|nr:hypothetical protein [Thermoanaerobaculia bacterium]
MIFLLEYDRSRGDLSSIRPYSDADRELAESDRLRREIELHRNGLRREIVLLQAESEEALREKHRRYFEDLAALTAAGARE